MQIPIDNERFAAAGLLFEQTEGQGAFTLIIDGRPEDHVLVRVPVADGQIVFFPRRSAAQRQVLALLGIAPE